MFEICSEFAMISMGGAIVKQMSIQCALSIAPSIEIIANIELTFTKYSNPAFYNILL